MNTTRLENLLTDLFSLEVNTIVKPGMTATKMPSPGQALIDLARDYTFALNLNGDDKEDLPNEVDVDTMKAIRSRAAKLVLQLQGLPTDSNEAAKVSNHHSLDDAQTSAVLLICRIRDNCDVLQGLAPTKEAGALTRANADAKALKFRDDKDRLVLKKAWEVGTEDIVMQTTIYLDGDVITRVRPDHATNAAILDAHRRAVETSIAFWGGLVDVVRSLFVGVIDKFRAP